MGGARHSTCIPLSIGSKTRDFACPMQWLCERVIDTSHLDELIRQSGNSRWRARPVPGGDLQQQQLDTSRSTCIVLVCRQVVYRVAVVKSLEMIDQNPRTWTRTRTCSITPRRDVSELCLLSLFFCFFALFLVRILSWLTTLEDKDNNARERRVSPSFCLPRYPLDAPAGRLSIDKKKGLPLGLLVRIRLFFFSLFFFLYRVPPIRSRGWDHRLQELGLSFSRLSRLEFGPTLVRLHL